MKTNNQFVQNINIGSGKITYCDFEIDAGVPLEEQLSSLQEDMLQIEFGDRFLVDVGWYPEMNAKGCFIVYVIQDEDWDNPLSKVKCSTLEELKEAIERAVQFIYSLNQ